jgi:hypothetical protein
MKLFFCGQSEEELERSAVAKTAAKSSNIFQREEGHELVGVQRHEQHGGHEHGCGDQIQIFCFKASCHPKTYSHKTR